MEEEIKNIISKELSKVSVLVNGKWYSVKRDVRFGGNPEVIDRITKLIGHRFDKKLNDVKHQHKIQMIDLIKTFKDYKLIEDIK